MRIGSSILLREGKPHQSHGFHYYTGLGGLEGVISGMTGKGIDEIAIINIDRGISAVSAKTTISMVEGLNCDTPIIYGGGFKYIFDDLLRSKNIERFLVSTQLIDKNIQSLSEFSDVRGRQSLIGCLPVFDKIGERLKVLNSQKNELVEISVDDVNEMFDHVDELLIIDCKGYGRRAGFSWSLISDIEARKMSRVIISGGVLSSDISLAETRGLAAVYLDNFLLHSVKCRINYAAL